MNDTTMHMPAGMVAPAWMTEPAAELAPVRRRRVRGLRVPALPSWPLLAQVAGGFATLAGVWGLWGPWLTLIVGGVAAVVLGMLKESDKI